MNKTLGLIDLFWHAEKHVIYHLVRPMVCGLFCQWKHAKSHVIHVISSVKRTFRKQRSSLSLLGKIFYILSTLEIWSIYNHGCRHWASRPPGKFEHHIPLGQFQASYQLLSCPELNSNSSLYTKSSNFKSYGKSMFCPHWRSVYRTEHLRNYAQLRELVFWLHLWI